MNSFTKFLLFALTAFLIIRFAGYIFYYAVKFWYVSLPVLAYFLIRKRRVPKKDDKEVIDAEFTVIDDDEEDKEK